MNKDDFETLAPPVQTTSAMTKVWVLQGLDKKSFVTENVDGLEYAVCFSDPDSVIVYQHAKEMTAFTAFRPKLLVEIPLLHVLLDGMFRINPATEQRRR